MRTICIALIMSLSIIAPLPMLAADKPPPDVMVMSEIALSLEKQGYILIAEIEFDDGMWKVDAYKDGQRRDLKVDPRSGQIVADKPKD